MANSIIDKMKEVIEKAEEELKKKTEAFNINKNTQESSSVYGPETWEDYTARMQESGKTNWFQANLENARIICAIHRNVYSGKNQFKY